MLGTSDGMMLMGRSETRKHPASTRDLPDTDESFVYDGLTEYPRRTIQHQARQYVVGTVHTNTIEGFWNIFKRGIVALSTRSAPSICRCTLLSSATTIGATRTSSNGD
jgi:hypothetical protein